MIRLPVAGSDSFLEIAPSKIVAVAALIAYISRNMTLEAGDIIVTGTPSGMSPVVHGDVMEVEIAGIGILRNPVVEEVRT